MQSDKENNELMSLLAHCQCVDIDDELESCGACGNDCSTLPGVRSVACREYCSVLGFVAALALG